jgi:hypothetical protein
MTPDILHTLAAVHALAVLTLTAALVLTVRAPTRRPHTVAIAVSESMPFPAAGGQLTLAFTLTQTHGPRRPPQGPRPRRPRRTHHQPSLPGLAPADLIAGR